MFKEFKESYKNLNEHFGKENPNEVKKLESMREVINKAVVREASDYWRKHIPVYGWTQMNYPSTIQPPLLEKYKVKEKLKYQQEAESLSKKRSVIEDNSGSLYRDYVDEDDEEFVKHKNRLYPDKVNEQIMKEIENLIAIDHTKKLMENYKVSDLKFFKDNFANYEKSKRNLNLDPNVPHNYNQVVELWSKSYLYELGYKKAFAVLTTNEYSDKCSYIDANLFFEKKYSTIYPKSNILGPEQDKNFSKKMKKIGDISFEEDTGQSENVKNLSRLPPENITEEWLKSNLNKNVEMLKLENCYWLSKDLISKVGRMDTLLKELSLRNLDIDNNILTNIVKWAKGIEILDLSYCNALTVGVCDILKMSLINLKSLKAFSLVRAINDKGLIVLGEIETLEELDIGLCSFITDSGLSSFCKLKTQKLQSLNLTGLLKISNRSIKEIVSANNTTMKHLTVSLLPQKSVTGEICSEINKCKGLISLDISGCFNINNDEIENLFSSGLENLEVLNISGLNINDSVAESAVGSNKYLKILRISNSNNLTNNFLDYLINNDNKLLLLEINKTNDKKLTDQKIREALKEKAPNLRIIRATKLIWDMRSIGLKVPLEAKDRVRPTGKGGKPAPKKNDDKNPINQLKKLLEENKKKSPLDYKI